MASMFLSVHILCVRITDAVAAKVRRPPRRCRSPSPPRSAAIPVAAGPANTSSKQTFAAPHRPHASSTPQPIFLEASSLALRPKMTSRFCRIPAVARGQAPRPGIVEDWSSSAHHNHRIRSMKTVSHPRHTRRFAPFICVMRPQNDLPARDGGSRKGSSTSYRARRGPQ
jgi:hypothetical protein